MEVSLITGDCSNVGITYTTLGLPYYSVKILISVILIESSIVRNVCENIKNNNQRTILERNFNLTGYFL
jgi:hypothetical protein